MKLRVKINLYTLLPISLNILLVVCLAVIPIYLTYPDDLNSLVDEMIEDQKQVLLGLARQQAYTVSNILTPGIQFALLLGEVIEQYYSKTLKIKPTFTGEGSSVNLVLLTNGTDVPVDYNATSNQSFAVTMWFDSPYNTTKAQLDEVSRQNLFDSEVHHFIMTAMAKLVTEVYMAYEEDGMYNYSPAEYSPGYLTLDIPNCTYLEGPTSYYEPRCRGWYRSTKANPNKTEATISDPYIFVSRGFLGLTICRAIWFGDTLKVQGCTGYSIDDVTRFFSGFYLDSSTYNYMLNIQQLAILHPKLDNTAASNSSFSIQSLEFTDNIEKEVKDFNLTVLPLFNDSQEHLVEYTKDHEDM
jgi:hypothetical protein